VDSSGGFVKSLFQLAYDRRLKAIEGSWLGAWGLEKLLWDVLVFKKIQAILGGNIRGMLSGGAPLSRDTQRFINICFGYDFGLCKIDFSRLMESLQSVFTILGVGALMLYHGYKCCGSLVRDLYLELKTTCHSEVYLTLEVRLP
jgi:hypothetical protein